MRKQKESALSNTKIAIVFFAFLAFIVGISLIFKFTTLLRNGQFDDSRSFTLSITNGKNTQVVALSPDFKSITIFKLNGDIKSEEAGRLLEIPIDGIISSDSLDLNQKINSLFFKAIINYNKLKTKLTIIDFLRIIIFARTVPESSINIVIVGDGGELGSNGIVGNLVNDSSIENDHKTIQVINGTGVNGLGNRLAKLITNMGGNVILVVTENNPIKKSMITYIDKKTYTVERLQKVLGYRAIKEPNNTMSDITIIIGEDSVNSAPF